MALWKITEADSSYYVESDTFEACVAAWLMREEAICNDWEPEVESPITIEKLDDDPVIRLEAEIKRSNM